MRKFSIWAVAPLACLLFTQCRGIRPLSKPVATLTSEGFITCFEPGLAEGKTWCEASAIVAQGDRIYLANDKDMPAPRSSVFFIRNQNPTGPGLATAKPTYLEHPLLRTAHKFEEFAQTPNRKWTFLTTAFDRIKPGSADFDGYNMLLAWQPGQEGNVQVVGAGTGATASLDFRKAVQTVLGGSPYFKIEGLAATDTHLWFGVREQGESYEKFDYRITILKAPYSAKVGNYGAEQITLGTPELVRNFDVGDVDSALPKPLAVSSLEYDARRRCFWLMTSFEQPDKIGAYLWVISERAMQRNGELKLVRTRDGKPLTFAHKAEDMTFIDANTLLVIHDDDRVRTRVGSKERQPNQTAYSVLTVN
ncbi:hypothetical protein [Fibrivirga algicola]|uniref:Esterase-like activity of phytase family protein n=1 Tax=Fibrivirga algicola TaxID=2950420 RepID=A0ABX0QQD6_9BACT|nr:hypothetical protein [Fibrivirga algicola]NID12988.1 hypothetical protein [Fibrivirga algicola]